MSREQIEGMAKVLIDYTNKNHIMASHVILKDYAESLYNAGYRKQSKGEWMWTEKGEADCEKYWVCSACKEHDFVKTKYCPNCGAKMKGGAE